MGMGKIDLKPYGSDSVSSIDTQRRRRNELWQNLNRYCRENGAAITSLPNVSPMRIEVGKTSNLATLLTNAGYVCHQAGRVTRITGGPRDVFVERDIIEVDLPKVY
jgi:hypothetical protein